MTMLSTMEWTVTIADPATARELATALTAVLNDAQSTISGVVTSSVFSSNPRTSAVTIPADVKAAVKAVQIQADALDVIARRDPDVKWHSGSKAYDAAKAAGTNLLKRAAAFKSDMDIKNGHRGTIVKKDSQSTAIVGARSFLADFSPVELLAAGFVVWRLFGKKRRGKRV